MHPEPPATEDRSSTTGVVASRRLQLLTAVGELLSSSLDYGRTLQHVARLALPALGDLCIVDILDGGVLRRVATAHVDDAKAGLLDQLARRYPATGDSPAPAARALESGRTEWLETVTPDVVDAHTVDAEHAALIRAIGMRSYVSVPMVARGATVGVIGLAITESDRRYGPDDIALAEELARRAALAIDNARLYAQARQELDERRRVESELRRSEERFRAVMEQSPLSTQLLDRDGRTIAVNAAWEALWGVTLADIAGYNVLADPQLDDAGITPLLRRAFAGEAVNLPLVAYDPQRTLPDPDRPPVPVRWVRAFAYPVRDADGAVQEVVLVHEDVSDARQAELRLRASEERLQRALGIGRMNAWAWDLERDTVACSSGAAAFWGREIGSAADFLAVVHPGDLDRLQAMTRTALEDGVPYDVEYRVIGPDGSPRWVRSRGDVERDGEGRPVRLLGITADVSEQKRAEQATRLLADAGETLGASLDYGTTLTELANVLIPHIADWYAVDLLTPEGTLARVSVSHPDPGRVEMAKALHARYPSRRGASHGSWHVIESGRPDWAGHLDDALLQRVAHDEEHLALLRGLGLRSYICAPLRARGTTIGAITLVYAESGRHYREADIELVAEIARRAAVAVDNARLYHDLQMADRRKDEFLAMLAHELRNPLAPISTAAQLLRMSAGGDERVLTASGIIARQVGHMAELVDDLLDVSRVTRGLVELEKRPVDLMSVVAGAVEQVQALVEARGHVLDIRTEDAPLVVDGDRARLVQVVANLLNNAAKYTPPGGLIALRVEPVDGHVRITVRDNGVGIERALLPHVFDLFTQAQRTPDRSQGGLGIGLALVRSIVQLHGGEVRVDSAGAGRGSEFTVVLPRAQPRPASEPSAMATTGGPAGARRVLVVDDNADAAMMLAEVLRVHGHAATTAGSGAEALSLVERGADVDVFVLDIGLPDMTGYELASRLRGRGASARATFVALTGYGQQHSRDQAIAAGFDEYLVKPADIDRLLRWLADDARP